MENSVILLDQKTGKRHFVAPDGSRHRFGRSSFGRQFKRVSKHHFTLKFDGETLFIYDNSANGTRLLFRTVPTRQWIPVLHDDILFVGGYCDKCARLKVLYPGFSSDDEAVSSNESSADEESD